MFRLSWFLAAVCGIHAAATEVSAAQHPASHEFDSNGVKIHYIVAGKGEPVVLIHGLYSSAEINWQLPGIFRELAVDHQVIALDLPGHGHSDTPQKEEAYGLQMVEDVILLMDHLKVKRAHVVGYSLGGIVALKLTSRHPDRVRSLLLGGMGWLREGGVIQKVWERLGTRDHTRPPAVFFEGVARLALTRAELKKINAPVKVVIGDNDPMRELYVVPLERARKDWPVIEIKDASHITCIMKKQFRDEIVRWVKANSLSDEAKK
jgi:pimeloyl-ACP methyl ester carboxylesterase